MKLTYKAVTTAGEILASLVSLTYVFESAFKGVSTDSSLLTGVWLIVSLLFGISKKLTKD